ncbi:MAG: CoA-binding protein, partial [Ignavibacteriae bacterium]|nr:CoA-binding protein [Ignavibacteriota bacterium]
VVGVSADKEKWGRKVYENLKNDGYKVYPINPNLEEIDGEKCYATLASIPLKIDCVMSVVPPQITEKIVAQMKELEIKKIWMQPGSESDDAIEFCKENKIEFIANACMLKKTGLV